MRARLWWVRRPLCWGERSDSRPTRTAKTKANALIHEQLSPHKPQRGVSFASNVGRSQSLLGDDSKSDDDEISMIGDTPAHLLRIPKRTARPKKRNNVNDHIRSASSSSKKGTQSKKRKKNSKKKRVSPEDLDVSCPKACVYTVSHKFVRTYSIDWQGYDSCCRVH